MPTTELLTLMSRHNIVTACRRHASLLSLVRLRVRQLTLSCFLRDIVAFNAPLFYH